MNYREIRKSSKSLPDWVTQAGGNLEDQGIRKVPIAHF
jgi:hypothetical protein